MSRLLLLTPPSRGNNWEQLPWQKIYCYFVTSDHKDWCI